MAEYVSKSLLKAVAKEVLDNWLEFGDEVFGTAFGEEQLDTGGIEADAYFATLFTDWDEAVRSMGLPANIETYRRYLYLRHLQLFGLRRDKYGVGVTAEKRIPPRLTPEENLRLVPTVKRDMERIRRGEGKLNPGGKIERTIAPNEEYGNPETNHNGLVSFADQPAIGNPVAAGPWFTNTPETSFGTFRQAGPLLGEEPEPSSDSLERRPMRPDDSFGTPGTRINLSSNQPTPVSVVRHASSGQSGSGGGHQYSMTIRPGERKTQRIELPGLTLELVVSLDA